MILEPGRALPALRRTPRLGQVLPSRPVVGRPALAGLDLSSLVKQAASVVQGSGINIAGISSSVTSQVLGEAVKYATDLPQVQVNRARAAALIDYGYEKLDQFSSVKPYVFWSSTAGLVACGYMGFRRRKIPEAVALYSVLGVISAGLAYLTRPDALRPQPAPMPASATAAPVPAAPAPSPTTSAPVLEATKPAPKALPQVLGWLDRRVVARSAIKPGWEATTLRRVAKDLGFAKLGSAVETAITRNSH